MKRRRSDIVAEGSASIRILLVEDHEVVRAALRVLLERSGGIDIVDEAGTAAEALAALALRQPDVAVVDLHLPDRSGIELSREIRVRAPRTKVLILTAALEEERLLSAVMGGADGYLYKTTSVEQLIHAIKVVASGKPYLGTETCNSFLGILRARLLFGLSAKAVLSSQELRVMGLVAEGKTNKEIAVMLELSDKTVKNYLSHVYEKLGVTNRAEATAKFCRTVVPGGVLPQGRPSAKGPAQVC